MAYRLSMFTIYWRDGHRQLVSGTSVANAVHRAGYAIGALTAIEFFAPGDCRDYVWTKDTGEWVRVTEVSKC
jgi:hypothetical protein